MNLIKENELCIYWEKVNQTGLFMSITRRTLKYPNLTARIGTIASKKQRIFAWRPLLDIKSMHVFCMRKYVCESVCNYVESYFEISIEYN